MNSYLEETQCLEGWICMEPHILMTEEVLISLLNYVKRCPRQHCNIRDT